MEQITKSRAAERVSAIEWAAFLPPAAIVLVGLCFGLIPLFRGQFFFFSDNLDQHFPNAEFLAQALKHGVIPQWWPDVGAGVPVIAEGEAQYSPIRLWLAATFSVPAAFMGEISIWFALTGLGTYLFLRRIGLHPLASSAGALSFMLGSQCVVYVRSMVLLRAACFLPWILWLAESSFRWRPSSKVLWWAPPILALQFLSGNPTFAVVTLVAVFCYLSIRILILWATADAPLKPAVFVGLRILSMWILIAILGVGIAAIQVVPTLKHVSQSVRVGGLSLEYAANSSHTKIKDFAQPFFPYVYDFRSVVTAAAGFYDGSLIAVGFLLALVGIRRANPPVWCLGLSGLLASLIALGASTPVYAILWRLPLLNGMRFPLRYQFWASFCFACIGAVGLNKVIEWNARRGRSSALFRPFLAIAIFVLFGAVVVSQLRPGQVGNIALCLIFLVISLGLLASLCAASRSRLTALLVIANLFLLIDLSFFRLHSHYAPSVSISDALKVEGVPGWLRRDPQAFRILSLFDESDLGLDDSPPQNLLPGSSPALWGLKSLGYHGSLQLRRYERVTQDLTASLLSGPDQASKVAGFLGFLQAKYVIAPHGHDLGWLKATDEGSATVWQNPNFRPGEFLVGRLEPEKVGSDESIVNEIRSRSIDFRQTAVIAADILPELNGLGSQSEVLRLASQYDAMGFHVVSDRPALLVIPSNYYPGWTAVVNGSPARIYRTNWVGMGILVNAGESVVNLRFSTPGFHTGMWLSILGLILWSAISLWSTVIRRRGTA